MKSIALGMIGQTYAEDFLKKKGYAFIERNWRARFGEIDLIFTYKGNYMFIEVKTMVKGQFFQPEDHMTFFKENKLRQLARSYLECKERFSAHYQIDLAAVDVDENHNLLEIRHYQNIIEDLKN